MSKAPAPPNVLLVQVTGVHPAGHDLWFLVEVVLTGVSGKVDFSRFTQPDPDVESGMWQVAYDERLLSPDGTCEGPSIGYAADESVWHGTMRCAFFFFGLCTALPFIGPTGPIPLPPITDMPDRLKFVEFVPPD